MSNIPTKVYYSKSLPRLQELHRSKSAKDFIVIVDQKVFTENKAVKKWLNAFPNVYPVKAGEDLKDAHCLTHHLQQIFALLQDNAHRGLSVIAIGGGSVGDFAGFVASIFKRGLDFIQIPSSWLAAIDSAHGGKNGLNLGPLKNQIGTFHHPRKVFIVQEVLKSQGPEQQQDAVGELVKMALITKKAWGHEVLKLNKISLHSLWKYIPLAVAEKYRIVSLDPLETKGLRHFLNLGHTFGHVIELEQQIPHGRAVAIGLTIALKLSYEMGLLPPKTWQHLQSLPMYKTLQQIEFKALSEKRFLRTLLQDKKKLSDGSIQFVCVKGLGKPVLKRITIPQLITAGRKYGFISSRSH